MELARPHSADRPPVPAPAVAPWHTHLAAADGSANVAAGGYAPGASHAQARVSTPEPSSTGTARTPAGCFVDDGVVPAGNMYRRTKEKD